MKQAVNPSLPPISEKFKNMKDPTEKELVYQLESTEKNSLLLLPAKKSFLVTAHKLKDDLMAKADLFDDVFNSNLKTAILNIVPSKVRTINHGNNRFLSETIAKMFPPLLILRDHILSELNREYDRVQHLRASTSSKRKQASELLDFLDDVFNLHSQLQQRVFNHRMVPTKVTLSKDIILSDSQRERLWSVDRVPVPVPHQFCVMCGHKSTNLPIENDKVQKHNKEVEEKFISDLKE